MRVKMLSQECGPRGNFSPGDEREVSAEHGRQLIAGRHAVDITPKMESAVVAPTETAAVVVQEAAIAPPVETRKQGKRSK